MQLERYRTRGQCRDEDDIHGNPSTFFFFAQVFLLCSYGIAFENHDENVILQSVSKEFHLGRYIEQFRSFFYYKESTLKIFFPRLLCMPDICG